MFEYFLVYQERRQQGRFAGFSVYVTTVETGIVGTGDNSSLCYKDGSQLPALNFTAICITHGRYVTFYNERLKGVTYPDGYADPVYNELCEVTIHGNKIHKSLLILNIISLLFELI